MDSFQPSSISTHPATNNSTFKSELSTLSTLINTPATMDLISSHFVPPLILSVPTEQITFTYVGADIEWQPEQNVRPLRNAK